MKEITQLDDKGIQNINLNNQKDLFRIFFDNINKLQ